MKRIEEGFTKVRCDVTKFSDESGRLSDRIRMVGPLVMFCGVYHGEEKVKKVVPYCEIMVDLHVLLCSFLFMGYQFSLLYVLPPDSCPATSVAYYYLRETHFSARTTSMRTTLVRELSIHLYSGKIIFMFC